MTIAIVMCKENQVYKLDCFLLAITTSPGDHEVVATKPHDDNMDLIGGSLSKIMVIVYKENGAN